MKIGGWARCLLTLSALILFWHMPSCAQVAKDVLMNERLVVPGDGQDYVFTFSPTANNLYTFQSFGEGSASAGLYLEGEEQPIASDEGFSFQARLIADATYHLRVYGQTEQVEVEMMRSALGRSFSQPIALVDLESGYDKAIARAYDTHWFRFTARESGLHVIRSTSQSNTVGYLLDENGNRLAVSDNLYSPYCLDFRIQYPLEAGRTYTVRVSARGGETGQYHLTLTEPSGRALPEAFELGKRQIVLREGEKAELSFAVTPQGALDDAVWVTSDAEVAGVDQYGVVTARAAGQAQIILSGVNAVEARCAVTVEPIPVTGLSVEREEYALRAGETLTIPYALEPENASDARVIVTSSDESVVAVQRRGLLAARAPGEAIVTITTQSGGYSRAVRVTVSRARSQYRALIMGMQRFEDGRTRLGAVNTTQGIADLFSRQSYGGYEPDVTMKLDMTRAEAVAAIRQAFSQARETDVSILYINTHGGVDARTPWLEFADGRLTAAQLEHELRKVRGLVVLLIDCCQSGAFISTETDQGFNNRFVEAFSSGASGRMVSSKYRILTSTSAAQDSYRINADDSRTENSMATVFSRSLSEAGGWDLIGDKAGRLRADGNQDMTVTLYEAYLYCRRRVNQYLSGEPVRQDVQVYPVGSQFALFERE